MIKKEINEIKALYDTVQECGIMRLCGCYVDADRKKVKTFADAFYNFPEEEMHKYLEIFRKTLSGTPGKNLIDMVFTEAGEGTGKVALEQLRKTELKDDALLDAFYDRVIENYDHNGNYLILVIFQSYDVPGMTEDSIEMDDASEEVYSYVLCSICPMKLTKPGLGFDDDLLEIHTLKQIFAVELPENGFLYPAFNDRSSDDSALLFSSRKTDVLQSAFLENVLGVSATLPAKQQKEGFTEFVSEVLGDEAGFETVLSIQENLNAAVKDRKSESAGEAVYLDKGAVRNAFEKSGVSGEKLQVFDEKFDEQFDMKKISEKKAERVEIDDGKSSLKEDEPASRPVRPATDIKVEERLFADNVAPIRSYEVKTSNMVLRINSKHLDILDTRVIDGKKCLVIELTDDMTVNGIPVKSEKN